MRLAFLLLDVYIVAYRGCVADDQVRGRCLGFGWQIVMDQTWVPRCTQACIVFAPREIVTHEPTQDLRPILEKAQDVFAFLEKPHVFNNFGVEGGDVPSGGGTASADSAPDSSDAGSAGLSSTPPLQAQVVRLCVPPFGFSRTMHRRTHPLRCCCFSADPARSCPSPHSHTTPLPISGRVSVPAAPVQGQVCVAGWKRQAGQKGGEGQCVVRTCVRDSCSPLSAWAHAEVVLMRLPCLCASLAAGQSGP
jgi:hypothetical protein